MTSADRIKRRMGDSYFFNGWRRKVHDLRLIVAGDYSRIDGESAPQIDGFVPSDLKRKNLSELYDVMTRDFEEGTSNKMLQAVKTLVMQTSYRFPSIDFDNIQPDEGEMNSLYLKARMGVAPRGCNAVHHMRLALLDYIIGGMGWVWCGVRAGKPVVQVVDSLDVAWDMDAKIVTDIRWVAVRWTDTLGSWVSEYGRKPFKDLIDGAKEKGNDAWMEKRVELWFYFDMEGDTGTQAVFLADSTTPGQGEPILIEPNPHTMMVDGISQPFLPLEPCYFMQIPSVRNPIGIAEMMLPAQMATRLSERYMRAVTERGAPWIDVETGAYEKEELDKLEQGITGEILTRNPSKPPAQIMAPMEIPKSIMEWYSHNDQELTAHSGANPYATGNRVEGVKYASEVVAIQGTAGLTAGTIAADHGGHYERVVTKFLYNAVSFDDMPLSLTFDGILLHFGPDDPVGKYLRPDADPVISEDSLQFQTREKRMQIAAQNLQVAIEVAQATQMAGPLGIAPSSIKLQYEDYLRACGVKNISKHFDPPEPDDIANPQMMGQQMAGQPPGQMAPGNRPMQSSGEAPPGNGSPLEEQMPEQGSSVSPPVISFPSVQPSQASPHS